MFQPVMKVSVMFQPVMEVSVMFQPVMEVSDVSACDGDV